MTNRPYLLVVDDDESMRALVTTALADEGHEVVAARDSAGAFAVLTQQRPAVILLDNGRASHVAEYFIDRYRELPGPHAPIVLFSAASEARQLAERWQVQGVLAKPFDLDDLLHLAQRYLQAAAAVSSAPRK